MKRRTKESETDMAVAGMHTACAGWSSGDVAECKGTRRAGKVGWGQTYALLRSLAFIFKGGGYRRFLSRGMTGSFRFKMITLEGLPWWSSG